MDDHTKLIWKQKLKQIGVDLLSSRIKTSRSLMESAQMAANSESKSSAGDKYETSRAMNQLEKDMHATQLNSHLKELSALQNLNVSQLFDHVTQGSVIQTPSLYFFIGAGLGKQMLDGHTIFFISNYAPLAAQLKLKKRGDVFLFQQNSLLIEDIF